MFKTIFVLAIMPLMAEPQNVIHANVSLWVTPSAGANLAGMFSNPGQPLGFIGTNGVITPNYAGQNNNNNGYENQDNSRNGAPNSNRAQGGYYGNRNLPDSGEVETLNNFPKPSKRGADRPETSTLSVPTQGFRALTFDELLHEMQIKAGIPNVRGRSRVFQLMFLWDVYDRRSGPAVRELENIITYASNNIQEASRTTRSLGIPLYIYVEEEVKRKKRSADTPTFTKVSEFTIDPNDVADDCAVHSELKVKKDGFQLGVVSCEEGVFKGGVCVAGKPKQCGINITLGTSQAHQGTSVCETNDYCSIDGVSLKQCDNEVIIEKSALIINVDGSTRACFDKYSIMDDKDWTDPANYACLNVSCKYGKHYVSNGGHGTTECSCSPKSLLTSHQVMINSEIVNVLAYAKVTLSVGVEKKKAIEQSVTCSKGRLITHDSRSKVFKVCKSNTCLHPKSELMPMEFVGETSLAVHVSHDTGVSVSSVSCDWEEGFCDAVTCSLCLLKIMNPPCYSLKDLVMTVLILIIMMLIMYIIGFLLKLLKPVLNVFKWLWRRVRPRRHVFSKRALEMYSLASLLATRGEACSIYNSMNAESISCDSSTCLIDKLTTIEIPTTNLDACLVMNTPGYNNTLKINVKSSKMKCSKQFLYWTTQATVVSDQHCYCYENKKCSEETCNHKANTTHLELPPITKGKLIKNGCSRVEGGWSEGCVSFSDSCCYYSAWFEATGPPMQVFKCTNFLPAVDVTINLNFMGKHYDIVKEMFVGEKTQIGPINIQLKNIERSEKFSLTDCFSSDGVRVFYSSCNSATELVQGKLGELRCPTEADARVISGKCQIADGLISTEVFNNHVEVNSKFINYHSIETQILPLVMDDHIVEGDSSSITSYRKGYINAAFLINSNKFHLARKAVKAASCTPKFKSLTGCVNCRLGASLNITMNCDTATMATISCPSLINPLVFTPSEGRMSLRAHFTHSKVKEECALKVEDKQFKFSIEGSLFTLYNDISSIDSLTSYGVIDHHTEIDFLEHILPDFHLIKSIIYVMVIVVLLVLVVKIIRR